MGYAYYSIIFNISHLNEPLKDNGIWSTMSIVMRGLKTFYTMTAIESVFLIQICFICTMSWQPRQVVYWISARLMTAIEDAMHLSSMNEWMDGHNYSTSHVEYWMWMCMAHSTIKYKYKCMLNIVRHDRKSNWTIYAFRLNNNGMKS